jgi:hypothetical protein
MPIIRHTISQKELIVNEIFPQCNDRWTGRKFFVDSADDFVYILNLVDGKYNGKGGEMAPKVQVRRGTTNMGNFTQEEIVERLGNGRLSVYDSVYFAEKDEWIEFDKLKDIEDYVTAEYHWKYRVQGQVHGPLTKQDLVFFIKEGKIIAQDWLYHPLIRNWTKVKDIDEFNRYAQEKEAQNKQTGILDDALQSGFYRTCPNCGMQNLRTATSCKGCKYIFKGDE